MNLLKKFVLTLILLKTADRFLNILKEIDDFNNKTKSSNKIVYDGWAVRNVYKNTGIGYSVNFFESYPSRRKTDEGSESIWTDINGSTVSTMEIKGKELFGKECLEPMKLRITIEQIEE